MHRKQQAPDLRYATKLETCQHQKAPLHLGVQEEPVQLPGGIASSTQKGSRTQESAGFWTRSRQDLKDLGVVDTMKATHSLPWPQTKDLGFKLKVSKML